MKIGFFGADKHGKKTLMAALLKQSKATQNIIATTYEHRCELLEALKQGDKAVEELIVDCLRRGGSVDLGCDPGMTSVGRELEQRIAVIRRKAKGAGGNE